jgi:hypothetical protein
MTVMDKVRAIMRRRTDPAARAAKTEKAVRRAEAKRVRAGHRRNTGHDGSGGPDPGAYGGM